MFSPSHFLQIWSRVSLPLAAGALMALAGCDGLLKDLETQEVGVAVLLATPDMKDPLTQEPIAGVTTIDVFFGQVDVSQGLSGAGITSDAYTGRADASVHLSFSDPHGGGPRDLVVPSVGNGEFRLDSRDEPQLVYAQVAYTVTIVLEGHTYRMQVVAPGQTDITEIEQTADGVIRDHVAGAPLTVTRADGQGADKNDPAFVRLTALGHGDPTEAWTNAPSDAVGFVDVVLRDDRWRVDQFVVPGSEFTRGSAYLLTLAPLARGEVVTTHGETQLFLGSAFFAGMASGGAVIAP
ncbi:MAG: hypothetical protein U1F43_16305 [Myxococcota bacterium]